MASFCTTAWFSVSNIFFGVRWFWTAFSTTAWSSVSHNIFFNQWKIVYRSGESEYLISPERVSQLIMASLLAEDGEARMYLRFVLKQMMHFRSCKVEIWYDQRKRKQKYDREIHDNEKNWGDIELRTEQFAFFIWTDRGFSCHREEQLNRGWMKCLLQTKVNL